MKLKNKDILEMSATVYLHRFGDLHFYPAIPTKAFGWLNRSKDYIKKLSGNSSENDDEDVTVCDLVRCREKDVLGYYSIGKGTLNFMREALMINNLSFGMTEKEIEDYREADNLNDNAGIECLIRKLCSNHGNGDIQIELGTSLLPGYNCSLIVRRLQNEL